MAVLRRWVWVLGTLLLVGIFGCRSVVADDAIKKSKQLRAEDRPKVIVSLSWEGEYIKEGTTTVVKLVLFNVGSTEARDIRVIFPTVLSVDPQVSSFEGLEPGAKRSTVVQVAAHEPVKIPVKDMAVRVEYHAKGFSDEYVGTAMPLKDFVVVPSAEYEARLGSRVFEWVLYVLVSGGVGVAYPAFKMFS